MLNPSYIEKYRKISAVFCPYFNEEISFNSKGLGHIKFTGQGKARSSEDQNFRIKHISVAPTILSKSHTLQGYLNMNRSERVRKNGKTKTKEVRVNYYEFIAVVEQKRFKVIVKQIGEGNKFFWSIIPFWKKQIQGRKLHSLSQEDTE